MIFDGEDVAVCRECETIWNLTKSGWKPEGLIEQKPTWKGKPKSAKPKQARRAVSSFDPGEDS